ncbi:MAG: zf-HC2 domain-containing protein [Planctomycetota bacterium]
MSASSAQWWIEGLTQECVQFQVDLSCLVDGELDEIASARAVAHLEGCGECRRFFDDTRQQVQAHRDVANPDGLVQRYSDLLGVEVSGEVESIELVCRLSNIFYQLGKAYTLSAIDPSYRIRVFEKAVPVEPARTRGRGFVDGVLESGRGGSGGVDWAEARHLFNGALTRIEGALDKGRRLLQEALSADANHEESRLYLGYIDVHEGRYLKASRVFQDIFDTAISELNRGHAAVQLALLHSREEDFRKAIAYSRWVTMSGLADVEDRFFFVRFNIGTYYARLRDQRRSIAVFRGLLDRHPDRARDVAGFFARSDKLRACIDCQPGFGEALVAACPELFRSEDPASEGEGGKAEDSAS